MEIYQEVTVKIEARPFVRLLTKDSNVFLGKAFCKLKKIVVLLMT